MNQKIKNQALWNAIHAGSVNLVNELIESDNSFLKAMTPFGTWLHIACSSGHEAVVRYFVEKGIDVNQRGGSFGGNALNVAVSNGYLEIAKYLLSCGSEIDSSSPERNPIFGAIYCGNIELVKLLVNSGADIHIKYNGEEMKDMDAVAFAKERGQFEIATFLSAMMEQ